MSEAGRLDGVYVSANDPTVAAVFRRVPAPTAAQLDGLDEESMCMDNLRGHSITYRIAMGRHVGKRVFTLQTLPAAESHSDEKRAKAHGFSLHAGVWAGANDRAKLERLCRYIARPAVSNERIELTECGHVRYTLKTPYRDGTTHVYFNTLEFIEYIHVFNPAGS